MVEWKSTVKFLFLDYYTTTYWNLQSGAGVQNQCEALYIIKTQFCISSTSQWIKKSRTSFEVLNFLCLQLVFVKIKSTRQIGIYQSKSMLISYWSSMRIKFALCFCARARTSALSVKTLSMVHHSSSKRFSMTFAYFFMSAK